MMYKRNSALWTEIFGHLDESWQTIRPSHQAFVDGIVDPSIWPASVPSDDDSVMGDTLHSIGVREVQRLSQHGLRVLATQIDNSVSTGIAGTLQSALKDALTPQSVGFSVPLDEVAAILTDPSDAGKQVATALFAAGMSALSCAGPLGAAAAAIIGFATMLVKVFKSRAYWKEKTKKDLMKKAFQQMPPLQTAGSDSDAIQVRRIFDAMQKGNWTKLFSPRFNPKREWVGAPRNGGYGFAPGERFDTKDEFGIDTAEFDYAGGGLGFDPGTQSITSVVQVSLDPIGDSVSKWYEEGRVFPVNKAYVRDVGDFYQSTRDLCAIAWAMVTQETASRHLYKVDVGTLQTKRDECLHNQWRNYSAGALNYLKVTGSEWVHWENFGLTLKHGRAMDRYRPEFLLGTGLSCVMGAWACTQDGRLRDKPLLPEQMTSDVGLYSACVLTPRRAIETTSNGYPCLISRYDRLTKDVLLQVRARQEHFLLASVVCAYVRSDWDAFRDEFLAERLDFAREQLLLTPRALRAVRLSDVSPTEKFRGDNWKERLKAAGAGKTTLGDFAAVSSAAIVPTDKPAPVVPEKRLIAFPVPEIINPSPTRSFKYQLLGLGAVAAFAGGAALFPRKR